jgi:flagellar assembly factor FliW
MLIQTRCFGEIDLEEDKILTFERGLIGFENCKQFTILYDNEASQDKEAEEDINPARISWLQSIEEPGLALPIINPLFVKPDYNPVVEDELLRHIGELTENNVIIFLTLNVPTQIEDMSVNLMAPIIINADTRCGAQIIVENDDYPIKFNVYETFEKLKEGE